MKKLNDVLEYKGYYSRISYDATDKLLHGKIEGINDLITFESDSSTKIESEFKLAVDDYLNFCEDIGVSPDKPYKGTFNIRISPELHKKISFESIRLGISLNQYVKNAIESYENINYFNIENIQLSFVTKEKEESILTKNNEFSKCGKYWDSTNKYIVREDMVC